MGVRSIGRQGLVLVATTMLGAAACAPATPPPDPDPVQQAIVTPQVVTPGATVTITAPNGQCDPTVGDGSSSDLIAGLASPATGAVLGYSWRFASPGGRADVSVVVPPSAPAGSYNVLLACRTAAGTFAFAPGTLVVTAPSPSPGSSPARPVATPAAGPAGSFVTISAPAGECDPPAGLPSSSQLIGGLALERTGETISWAWAYPVGGATPTVRVRVPPAVAPGTYNVFLACLSGPTSFAFSPATFTVTG